jgi:hypothetical protein
MELTIQEASSLLASAQTCADDEAQDQIKLLIEDAEQTPHVFRTEAQLYLLHHGRSHVDSRLRTVRLRSPADVDAELTIEQVSSLMAAAASHSEGDALDEVRHLIREAKRTPESMRTPAQLNLLLYLRNTSRSSGSSSLVPPIPLSDRNIVKSNAQSSATTTEIFVDASGFGIGFVFNGRWLGWVFKKRHPEVPKGPDGKIVMSWAEIIAVELGIHALIAAGYRSTEIILRSDNYGVVLALARKSWTKNYGVEAILQRILLLCRSVGFVVIPKWVSTHVNPADGPSRGLYPPREMRFGYVPEIPPHLGRFLLQVGL